LEQNFAWREAVLRVTPPETTLAASTPMKIRSNGFPECGNTDLIPVQKIEREILSTTG
jgi:hypothetical protein